MTQLSLSSHVHSRLIWINSARLRYRSHLFVQPPVSRIESGFTVSTVQLPSNAKVSVQPDVTGRIAGLDALRAGLAVLVVMLHASMPYMLSPFPGLAWPVHDAAPSAVIDAIGWWSDSLVMPTFLLLAGFSAAQLMHQKGPRRFLNHRVKRILVPLVCGMIVLLPIELYLWIAAWVGQGEIAFVKLKSLKLDPPHGNHLWGLSHLWFLQYLFLYSLVAWCVVRVLRRDRPSLSPADCSATRMPSTSGGEGQGEGAEQDVRIYAPHPGPLPHDETVTRIQNSLVGEREYLIPLTPPTHSCRTTKRGGAWLVTLLGGLLAGSIMCVSPRVLIGFQHGWWPHPANFACFGLIFAAGWWLAHRHRNGADLTAGCELSAVAGLALFAISLPGVREFAALRDADAFAPWTTAIPFGLSGWLSAVGWTGVFIKHVNRPQHPAVRYFAESSFWLYLMHHPLVALLHIDLALVNWPSELKFAVASSAAIAISLAMYECLVRRTRLGILFNGRRHIARPTIPPAIEETQIDDIRPRRAA